RELARARRSGQRATLRLRRHTLRRLENLDLNHRETLSDYQISINPHDALEKARAMIEHEGGSNSTLRISSVATALARDHGVDRDDQIRTRFFEILDQRMDATGPGKNLVKMLGKFEHEGCRLGIVTFVRKPRIARRLD